MKSLNQRQTVTIVYARTDYDKCPLITPGYLYEVIDENFEMGTFKTRDGDRIWKKDSDIGFQDWERIAQQEEIPNSVTQLDLSETKIIEVLRIIRDLKEDLSSVNRKQKEAERAAWEYYLATGPRISLGKHTEPTEQVAAFAEYDAGSYDAAKIITAELLEKGEPLPERLASFAAKALRGMERPKSGRGRRGDSDLRNEVLAYAVWRLDVSEILSPTKSTESEKVCGYEFVADVYDELLANDIEGVILKPKGGEFGRARMRDIWLKDPDIRIWKEWQKCLPD